MKTISQITRKLRGERGQNQNLTVKVKDGSTITEEKGKPERWREHLQQLHNRCDPPTLADIGEAEQNMDIKLAPITIQVVKEAFKMLKNGKAPGDDNVYAETLKAEEQGSPQLLQHILQDIWDNEMTSNAWKRGTIIKLPKKGNLSECNNRRGSTQLSITSKVFCRIILQRIITTVEKLQLQEQ